MWKVLNLIFGVLNLAFAVVDLATGNIWLGTLLSAIIGTLNFIVAFSIVEFSHDDY